jgi:hypothetical protein
MESSSPISDLSALTAQPSPLKVRGRTYWVHPLTVEEIAGLQSWVDAQFPDPFELVRNELDRRAYNMAQQQFLLEKALEKASAGRRLIGTPEADRVLQSMAGTQQLLYASIRKGDPEFTEEQAEELSHWMTLGDLERLHHATTLSMVFADPKESSGTGPANGKTISRSKTTRRSTGGSSSIPQPSSCTGPTGSSPE